MTVTQEHPGHAAAPARPAAPAHTVLARSGAEWRDVLEARWRDRLEELTELCVTFHEAGTPTRAHPSQRRLMQRAVAARQALAETDAALARLTGGTFGRCEDCAGHIPALRLLSIPELRYCPRCAA
jgi:DnaK suppressor protein